MKVGEWWQTGGDSRRGGWRVGGWVGREGWRVGDAEVSIGRSDIPSYVTCSKKCVLCRTILIIL